MTTEVRLFGSVEVRTRGRVLGPRDFGGRKPKQLLEILVLQQGHYVAKEQLAEMLWPERLPLNHQGSLEHYVSLLRKRLDPTGHPQDSLVVTGHGGYRFDSGRIWADFVAFDEIADQPGAMSDLALIERALALAPGELLEDEPYAEWAIKARAYYGQRRVQLLVAGADAALAHADPLRAAELARAALQADPLVESAHRALMTAHYVRGDQHEALLDFRRCQRVLAEEVGLDPLPETLALHKAILDQVAPAEILPRRPARVLPASPRPGRLDIPRRPPLLGRVAELATLLDACSGLGDEQGVRLVVVEGEAGIGKTRLLDEAADRLTSVPVLRLHCSELEARLRGSLAADLVRAVAGGHPGVDSVVGKLMASGEDPLTARPGLVEAVAGVLRDSGPFLLMVDDAQWADADSVALLGCAARRAAAGAVLLAYRSEDLPVDHPLAWLESTTRIVVEPLTREELAPLAVPRLHEHTGGLPLHVVDRLGPLLDGNVAAAPQLSDLVLTRLRRLGEALLRVAVVATVALEPFGPEEVARLLAGDALAVADQLEHLCALRFLRVQGDGFAFRYPAHREALRQTVSPARRRLLERYHRTARSPVDRRLCQLGLPPEGDRRVGPPDRRAGALGAPQLRVWSASAG